MALFARASGSVYFLYNNCYSKVILNYSKLKLHKKHSLKDLAFNKHFCNIRFSHTDAPNTRTERIYIRYDELLAQRRSEARRSLLIEVQSDKSCNDICTYCSQFGKINAMYHYTTHGIQRHFVLIEFETQENVDTVLSASTHVNYEQIIPVQSTMLWFRNITQWSEKKQPTDFSTLPMSKYSCKMLSNVEIFKLLITAKSVSEQIKLLHDATKLNDAGARLRFLTAYQIERSFISLFPHMAVLPFGSSVNGFGKQGCDLDLSLVFEKDKVESSGSRLVFHTKSILTHEKHQMKRLMETVADVMNIFLPGVTNVRKILEARVPIIKFDHVLTGIECDLAMSNMSAYYMSELLYIYGEIDWRVRPLIFTVRKWAQSLKLTTKNIPGPWITNFSLSLMVLFYLQQNKILPPLNLLKSQATKDDIRTADICIDCTFQRDITKIPKVNKSGESLEKLLLGFFTYFGNFDFETKAISLREGKPISKPEYAALYICNPLETTLNVSKNVKYEELERIRVAMRTASWQLEASDNNNSENWGLVGLLVENYIDKTVYVRGVHNKPIDVQALFENNNKSIDSVRKTLTDKKKQRRSKTKLS